MNAIRTAAVIALSALALGTQAAQAEPATRRAQVQAELAQYKASGQYTIGEQAYPVANLGGASLSRAQVSAELAQAKAAGLSSTGEQAYPVALPGVSAAPTRAQVRAELLQARADGLIPVGEQENIH